MDGELVMDEEEGLPEKNGEKGQERGGEEFPGPQHQRDRDDDFMVSLLAFSGVDIAKNVLVNGRECRWWFVGGL
jgi:hypothetical protein